MTQVELPWMPIFSSSLPTERALRAPEAPSGLTRNFGHDEERDALDAGGRAGGAGEDEVDDVLGEVVVAGGDEDLLAGDAVAAVGLRLGAGAQEPEVGAGVRLGQVHGAGPLAGHELRQVGGLLRLGAVGVDGGVGAVGEAGVHAERHVGGGVHLADGGVDDVGHALAAVGGVAGEAGPAALAQEVEGAPGSPPACARRRSRARSPRGRRRRSAARRRRGRSCRPPRGSRR